MKTTPLRSMLCLLAAILAATGFTSCSSTSYPASRLERTSSGTLRVLNVKTVQLNPLIMGYAAPNKPDSRAEMTIAGSSAGNDLSYIIITFYPVGDSRLGPARYDAAKKTLFASQGIDALPAWLSAMTAIRGNEASGVSYYTTPDGRYEIESTRLITSK